MKYYSVLLLSIVAVIFSIVAVCLSWNGLGFNGVDVVGIIIGVAGLIVTVTIGWQIWNVIEFDSKVRQIVKKEVAISNDDLIDGVNTSTWLALSNIGHSMMVMERYVAAMSFFIKATISAENANDSEDKIKPCIDYVLTCMLHIKERRSQDSVMREELKDTCIGQMAKIKHERKSEIIAFIISLPNK